MRELPFTLLRIAPALKGWKKKSVFEINTINTESETKEHVAHWAGVSTGELLRINHAKKKKNLEQ